MLNEAEISLYLNEWMVGAGPSQWLKKLWAVPDLRERVSSAALHELENWDSSLTPGGSQQYSNRSLGWAAYVRRFPKKSIRLRMLSGSSGSSESQLYLAGDSSDIAKKAFQTMRHGNLVFTSRRHRVELHRTNFRLESRSPVTSFLPSSKLLMASIRSTMTLAR